MVGGYAMIDFTGLDFNDISDPVTIDGIFPRTLAAMNSGKPLLLYGTVYNGAAMTPLPVQGYTTDGTELFISGLSFSMSIDDTDAVTVTI